MSTFERRTWAETIEVRAITDAPMPTLAGYGLRFHKRSLPMGRGFVEEVEPGAVTKTLQESDVLGLWNHNIDSLLGRTKAGTLRVTVDERGMPYELDLPNTSLGRDVAELARRGDVVGSSFGFRTIGEDRSWWGRTEDGYPLRRLKEIAMRDVSPTVTPAYPDATASLRCLAEDIGIEVRSLVDLANEDQLIRALDADSPREIRRQRVVIV